ncbi:MAG: O-methyltransferase [Bacteroidota bacterium]
MDFIDPKLQAYAERFTTPENELLAELNRETYLKVLYPRMLSGHIQGRFLSFLSRIKQPKSILEIGTYTGYSAICLAEGMLPEGQLTTIEIDPEREAMIRDYLERAGLAGRYNLLIGPAGNFIPKLNGPFDLVFLDADKENYIAYFDLVLPKLATGGMIIADNVLWSGRVLDENEKDKETVGLRNFVRHVDENPDTDQILVPIRDGIMLIIKN